MMKGANKFGLNSGIYTYPEIARVLGIPYSKVERWMRQYFVGKLGEDFRRNYTWQVEQTKAVGFHTMVELFIFYRLHEHGVPPKAILEAHKELAGLFGNDHPFATREVLEGIRCDGKQVLLKRKDETVLSLNGSKQFNLSFVLDFMKKLEFKDEIVSRFWPLGKTHAIICDPKHQFGHPIIEGTNILPDVLADMHKAGDSIRFIAANYEIEEKQVRDALSFCKQAA